MLNVKEYGLGRVMSPMLMLLIAAKMEPCLQQQMILVLLRFLTSHVRYNGYQCFVYNVYLAFSLKFLSTTLPPRNRFLLGSSNQCIFKDICIKYHG